MRAYPACPCLQPAFSGVLQQDLGGNFLVKWGVDDDMSCPVASVLLVCIEHCNTNPSLRVSRSSFTALERSHGPVATGTLHVQACARAYPAFPCLQPAFSGVLQQDLGGNFLVNWGVDDDMSCPVASFSWFVSHSDI